MSGCCAPHGSSRGDAGPRAGEGRTPTAPPEARTRLGAGEAARGMATVPAGSFRMGGDDPCAFPADGEGPVRTVTTRPYRIDACTVTNRQFSRFVRDTGHVTDAERYGWSFVFYALVHPQARQEAREGQVPQAPWWLAVGGATWRAPYGPGSGLRGLDHHPVVHVSWHDAAAYAAWAGKRLPTEAEWERGARGGLDQARYPWGDELLPRGRHRCNIWQGSFPGHNTGEDGHLATAPAKSFRANGYGLYNVAGNVWEWCADWWSTDWHVPDTSGTREDPAGPGEGTAKVIRGGSYLCHSSYCNRYRVAARTSNTPDTSTGHTGFRCVADIETASGESRATS